MAEAARKTYDNPPTPTREDLLSEHGMSEKEAVDRMNALGNSLDRIAQDTVGQRQPIERRWLDDLRQYNGEMLAEDKARVEENRSSITVKITRARTNTAEARQFDMLFPTDDKNWGIRPTPVPSLPPGLEEDAPLTDVGGQEIRDPQTGEPVRAQDMRTAEMSIAHERAKNMEKEIEDQLTESLYSSVARDVIHDSCLWGTGVLKGPIVHQSLQRVWIPREVRGKTNWILSFVQNYTPIVARTDPWNFFPEIGPLRIGDCEYVLERHLNNKRQVHKLAQQPGFIASQLRKVLETEPSTNLSGEYHEMLRISGMEPGVDKRYVFWEYHGLLDKEDLIAINPKLLLDKEKSMENPLEMYEGVVWFCNGIVVKAIIEPLDTGDFPYSVYNWEKDDSSILGFGVPYVMRNTQRVIDAAWRMTMDNAGLAAGPQIVANSSIIKPADGVWNIHARKVWVSNKDTADVSKAFATFDIPSHIPELLSIFNTAMGLVDEETNLPIIVRGSSTSDVAKTAGGMALLQNNANVILRRQTKNWDDDITTPTIRRFYDWNMQYSDDERIKGDMKIDARGSSVLLVREIEAQNIVQGMQFLDHPILGKFHKPYPLLKRAWKAMQVDPEEVLVNDDEAERIVKSMQEGNDVSPEVQAAQIEQQSKQAEIELKREQIAAENHRAELQHQAKMAELAQKGEVTIQELQTKLGIEQMRNKTERDKTVVEVQQGDPFI